MYVRAMQLGPVALILMGCVSTDVTPIAQDTVIVSSSAARACGRQGARKMAFVRAASETIRRGYDKFIVVSGQAESDIRIVGTTPVYGTTNVQGNLTGSTFYGTGSTTVYGGQPIYGGRHNQDLVIKMFRYTDAGAANALDARAELGPEWEKKIQENKNTCF